MADPQNRKTYSIFDVNASFKPNSKFRVTVKYMNRYVLLTDADYILNNQQALKEGIKKF